MAALFSSRPHGRSRDYATVADQSVRRGSAHSHKTPDEIINNLMFSLDLVFIVHFLATPMIPKHAL